MATSKDHDTIIRTAAVVESLSDRLFGANGDDGAMAFLLAQHKEMRDKLDTTRAELLSRMDDIKKDSDKKNQVLEDKHNKLDKRVTWYSGAVATISGLILLILALLKFFKG